MTHDPAAIGETFDGPLRQLYLLAVEPDLTLDEKIARLLELGCEALGLELGIVSQIRGDVYECIHVHGPDWSPAPGARFDVGGTYCLHTLRNDGVTGFWYAGREEISSHPCYRDFGLESYIGAPVLRGGARFGTLNFSATAPRPAPFSEPQREFVGFLARWLGNELKLAAERRELSEQRSRFASVIDAVPDVIVVTDPNRRIELLNPAFERHFGYRREQLLGRQTSVFYDRLEDYETLSQTAFTPDGPDAPDSFHALMRRADGSRFDAKVSYIRMRTETGRLLGYLGVIRDVTEEKQFERAMDQLIGTVSHEIRSPIAALYGAVRLLADSSEDLSPERRKLLDITERNAGTIQKIVGELLDLEKLRHTQGAGEFEQLALAPLLGEAAQSVGPFAEEHGVRLAVKAEGGPAPRLSLDPVRIVGLVSNLLTNAVKASPEGGRVTVRLCSDGRGFTVEDEGAGIPDDLVPVLFDRFSRAESYRVKEGSGLGLSIVRAIVDQHMGEISLDTAENRGTTFTVRFPDAEEDAPVPATAAE